MLMVWGGLAIVVDGEFRGELGERCEDAAEARRV
jgi:hypothetical protein